MPAERRSVARWAPEHQLSVRRMLTRLDLAEDAANEMSRDALVALVRERRVHLADRAQLEYVYGPGPQDPPLAGSAGPPERSVPAPPSERPRAPSVAIVTRPGDFRRAAADAAREAVRQMDDKGQGPAPRPWWWRLWPPNWREESS